MKAAVYHTGELPKYADFPAPEATREDELLVTMKAVAIKHLDKAKVSGKHYSSANDGQARVAGGDGVGVLPDGRRVYALGQHGTMAEQAVIDKDRMVTIPDGLDDAIAAALPNAIMGSALALRFRAGIKPGDTVLINGATGFTGKMAVQVARHYGAGRIIVTGRNERLLEALKLSGADDMISLKQDDEAIRHQLKAIHTITPFDIVLDYVWGHSAELILSSLKGNGHFSHPTKFVTVGAMSGDTIQLSSQILRSVDLKLSGSGLGSWSREEVKLLFSEILPEMFRLAADKKLEVDTITISMRDIADVWHMDVSDGKRLVVLI